MHQGMLAGGPSEAVLQVAAARLRSTQCAVGEHRQETDADTGNEVCGLCGTVLDDYADVDADSSASTGARHRVDGAS
jgi:hypothetical protein